MIFDLLQARDIRNGVGGGEHATALHMRQVVDLIIAASSEHAGCYLAMRYGLARAKAGHVSLPLLAKSTRLPRKRCEQIMGDMRDIITRAGGLG